MLLLASLHFTLSLIFCTPRTYYDLSIGLGVFPVLITLLSWWKVPSTVCDDTAHLPPWTIWRLGPLLRTPGRRLSTLAACCGPRIPP